MTVPLIIAFVFLAALLQTVSGFGFALMVMPLAAFVLGLRTAAPLVALLGLTLYGINVVRYRRSMNAGEVARLAIASAVGVPIGIWLLSSADEAFVKRILGLILTAYAIYALLKPTTSLILSKGWAYPAGFAAGCLGGAYNTPGPPAIVYGSLRQWPKDEFRAVMQMLFFLNALLVVTSHYLTHHYTQEILRLYLWTVPAALLGLVVGYVADRWVDRGRFRLLVSIMILAFGLSLIFGLGQG
jgi:uncharacterized membrane protein YfcA